VRGLGQYLVSDYKYVDDKLSKYLVPASESLTNDKRYRLGISEAGKIVLYARGRVEIIAKPANVTIKPDGIYVTFPNGVQAVMGYSQLKHDPEEFLNLLRAPLLWRLVTVGKKVRVLDYDEVLPAPAYDIADNILRDVEPFLALVRGFGYVLHKPVIRIMIPRLCALVSTEPPIHVFQVSPKETAKTHIGVLYMRLFNWFYCTSVPTKAGMLYDARTGSVGFVMISDGVVFDEVDKWSVNAVMSEELLNYLPTLMEQGIVIRPTTRRFYFGMLERRIPFMFLGNPSVTPSTYEVDRDYMCRFFSRWGDVVCAIGDRVAIPDVVTDETRVLDYVSDKVLPDAVLIAMTDILKKEYSKSKPDTKFSLKGRLRRHAECVYRAFDVLGIEPNQGLIEKIVEYGFESCLKTTNVGSGER